MYEVLLQIKGSIIDLSAIFITGITVVRIIIIIITLFLTLYFCIFVDKRNKFIQQILCFHITVYKQQKKTKQVQTVGSGNIIIMKTEQHCPGMSCNVKYRNADCIYQFTNYKFKNVSLHYSPKLIMLSTCRIIREYSLQFTVIMS